VTRKRKSHFPTDEELKKAFRHLIAIGAVVGVRGENGEVRWTLDRNHPYCAHISEELDAERPPEIKH